MLPDPASRRGRSAAGRRVGETCRRCRPVQYYTSRCEVLSWPSSVFVCQAVQTTKYGVLTSGRVQRVQTARGSCRHHAALPALVGAIAPAASASFLLTLLSSCIASQTLTASSPTMTSGTLYDLLREYVERHIGEAISFGERISERGTTQSFNIDHDEFCPQSIGRWY
jgi:hypothetical protein